MGDTRLGARHRACVQQIGSIEDGGDGVDALQLNPICNCTRTCIYIRARFTHEPRDPSPSLLSGPASGLAEQLSVVRGGGGGGGGGGGVRCARRASYVMFVR